MTRSVKAALIGLLAVPALVAARGGAGKRTEFLKQELGLSAEAADKVAAVMDKGRKEGEPLAKQLHASLSKLAWQVAAEESDKDVAATVEQVHAARAALRSQIERVGKEIDALLTPQQRAKMMLARGPKGPPPPFDPEALGGRPPCPMPRPPFAGPGPWDEE